MSFIAHLFSPQKHSAPPPAPIPIPAPAAPTDYQAQADAKAAADNQRKAALAAKGRQSTILTGGLGDMDMATTYRPTLLGGSR